MRTKRRAIFDVGLRSMRVRFVRSRQRPYPCTIRNTAPPICNVSTAASFTPLAISTTTSSASGSRELEALVARKRVLRPDSQDERAELIRRKGEEHERGTSMPDRALSRRGRAVRARAAGRRAVSPGRGADARSDASAAYASFTRRRSSTASSSGTPIFFGASRGRRDLGEYGYEVVDTKLALSPKAYYLVQLCNYSEHLERLQGRLPEFGHVVFGNGEEQRFRMNDYMAYYRHLKSSVLGVRRQFGFGSNRDGPASIPASANIVRLSVERSLHEQTRKRRSLEPGRMDAPRPDRQARSGRYHARRAARAWPRTNDGRPE